MPGGEIELTLGPWCPAALEREPVSVGVPFPRGALASANEACLFDGETELHCQRRILSRWPDGSIRWLLLDFQVTLPANARKTLRLACGRGASQAVLTETGISLAESEDRLIIDNGPLRITARTSPFELLESVALDGREALAPRQSQGFRLVDLSGTVYTTAACERATVTIEAGGPLRAAIRFEGTHRDQAGHPLLGFSILLTTWSDKPYAAVDYQVVHCGGPEPVELQEVSYRAAFSPREPVDLQAADSAAFGPGQCALVRRSEGALAIEVPREPSRLRAAGGEACLASPWIARAEGRCGIAAGIRHALQQFPKRLAASREGLDLDFYPAADTPLRLHQGSAKSHEMLLCFYAGEPGEGVSRRFLLFDLAPRPVLQADSYREAGAFGPGFPSRAALELDMTLDEAFDARPRATGILHFGDEPDPARAADRPPSDQVVWNNNACDLIHALVLHYARTGQHRHFAAAEALARHVVDVDHVHFSTDPLRDGGLAAPSVDHCRNALVDPAHQWVEGLLDVYHLTGSQPALLAVRRVGENVLRHVPGLMAARPAEADPESIGWALYTLTALHEEFGRAQYSDAARRLIDHLATWSSRDEGFAAAFPPGRGHAVVLTAIGRYHGASGEQRAADLFLREVDALLARPDALPWRQVHPAAPPPDPAAGALLLEPLARAWALTGAARYLEAGAPLVRRLVLHGGLRSVRRPASDAQEPVGDALVQRSALGPAAGVHLALVVRPLLAYLAAADAAGLLQTVGL